MKDIYAVLDIGSATLKFLVAEISSINVNILFVKTVASHGVKKGIIEDDRILAKDIKKLIEEAEQIPGNKNYQCRFDNSNYKSKIVSK